MSDSFIWLIIAVLFFLLGVVAGGNLAAGYYKDTAVKAGVGRYNSTNAQFEYYK